MTEKKYLKIKLILLILTLTLVLLFIGSTIVGSLFNIRIPILNGLIYSSDFNGEEIIVDKTYTVSDIAEISVSTAAFDIHIKEHSEDTVEFNLSSVTGIMQYKQSGDTLYLEELVPRFFNSGLHNGDLTIYVPENSIYDYEIDNVSGYILMENKAANEIDIDSVSGNTNVKSKANSLDIDNVSGDIYSYSVIKDISFDTVSGNIFITSDETLIEVEADSVSGDVTINLLNTSEISIDFESLSGDINNFNNNLSTTSSENSLIEFNSVSGDLIFDSFN